MHPTRRHPLSHVPRITSVLVAAGAFLFAGCGGKTVALHALGDIPDVDGGTPFAPLGTYPSGMVAAYGDTGGVSFFTYASATGFIPLGALDLTDALAVGCEQIAFDANRNLYLTCTDETGSFGSRVLVFANGATGGTPPLRNLSAPILAKSFLLGSTVDSKGNVYVVASGTTENESGDNGAVIVFGPDSDTVPIRVIQGANTQLFYPNQISIDAHDNIYVGTDSSPVVVFPPGADGDVNPSQQIGGGDCAGTEGVSVDSSGRVIVACIPLGEYATLEGGAPAYGIYVFANGVADHSIFGPTTRANSLISTAVDSAGRIYTGDFYGFDGDTGVFVYAAGASGDVAPEAILPSVSGISVAVAP